MLHELDITKMLPELYSTKMLPENAPWTRHHQNAPWTRHHQNAPWIRHHQHELDITKMLPELDNTNMNITKMLPELDLPALEDQHKQQCPLLPSHAPQAWLSHTCSEHSTNWQSSSSSPSSSLGAGIAQLVGITLKILAQYWHRFKSPE